MMKFVALNRLLRKLLYFYLEELWPIGTINAITLEVVHATVIYTAQISYVQSFLSDST